MLNLISFKNIMGKIELSTQYCELNCYMPKKNSTYVTAKSRNTVNDTLFFKSFYYRSDVRMYWCMNVNMFYSCSTVKINPHLNLTNQNRLMTLRIQQEYRLIIFKMKHNKSFFPYIICCVYISAWMENSCLSRTRVV